LWESYTIVSILQLLSISLQGRMLDISNITRACVVQFIRSFQSGFKKRKPKKRAVFVDRGLTEGQIFSLSAQMSAVPLSRGNELLFLIRLAWARATPVCSFTVVRSKFRRKPLLIHSLYGANRFTQGSCVFFAVSHKSTNSLTFACPSECPEFTPLAGLTETTAALIPRTFNPI